MKKVLSLVVVSLLVCAPALAASPDFSGMSLAELIDAQDRLTAAMWASDDWQSVTVPPGVYEIGRGIPVGHWTICPSTQIAGVAWGSALDEYGADIDLFDRIAKELLVSPDYPIPDLGIPSVSYKLTSGTFLIIEKGSVIFTPYAGSSLSFK